MEVVPCLEQVLGLGLLPSAGPLAVGFALGYSLGVSQIPEHSRLPELGEGGEARL